MNNPHAARIPGNWMALLVIATAQLMLVLDDSISNIALPSVQAQFGVPSSILPWVVNAYVLAFGGLLLLGGRVGDLLGRRKVFRGGLCIFTAASLAGGFAWNVESLVAARALQGVGAALAAPNGLALISTNFPIGAARNKAMAVYGAMSALGITAGVLLGGVLTGTLGWRWVFFINVPVGLGVLAGTRVLLEGERGRGKVGAFGAAVGTAAILFLVIGITRAGETGWAGPATLISLAAAAVTLAVFVAMQARSADPMLPLFLLGERNRAGSYGAMLLFGAGMMGTYYLLTLFLQQVTGFGPTRAGVAALPFAVGIIVGAGIGSRLVEKLPPRVVAVPGLLLGALGMFWLSRLTPETSYFTHIMPGVFAVSAGLGASAIATTLTAVHGVPQERVGVASAVVNMAQQIGAALGIAAMTAISTAVSDAKVPQAASTLHAAGADPATAARAAEALAAGYATAFLAGSALLLVAAATVGWSVNTRMVQKSEGVPAR
jgi:EmrB/QacA subfamily drug resistance transporter